MIPSWIVVVMLAPAAVIWLSGMWLTLRNAGVYLRVLEQPRDEKEFMRQLLRLGSRGYDADGTAPELPALQRKQRRILVAFALSGVWVFVVYIVAGLIYGR